MKLPYSQDEWQKQTKLDGNGFVQWIAERTFSVVAFEFKDVEPTRFGPYLIELRIGNLSLLGFASLQRLLNPITLTLPSLKEWPIVSAGQVIRIHFSGDFTGSVRLIHDEV